MAVGMQAWNHTCAWNSVFECWFNNMKHLLWTYDNHWVCEHSNKSVFQFASVRKLFSFLSFVVMNAVMNRNNLITYDLLKWWMNVLTWNIKLGGCWKEERMNRICKKMNNRKRRMTFLRMLQKTHNDHPNLREYLDKLIVEIYTVENISAHQVFFIFFVFTIIYDLLYLAILLQTKN